MNNNDCVFCAISKDRQAVIWENDFFVAFRDRRPKAKTHILVIPRQHIKTLSDISVSAVVQNGFMQAITAAAMGAGLTDYKVQINVGKGGGQHVFHVHAHILAN